jgi:hypothetical protein
MSSAELQDLASIATLIQTLFFIISVFFIGYQIREHNRITRAASTQSLVELSSPFLLQLSQDRTLAELWVNGAKNYETLDAVDQFRYVQLLFWWLILHENIFYQYYSGLVDQQLYQGWQVELRAFIQEKRLSLFWDKEMKPFFRTEFQQVVQNVIRRA